MNFIKESHSKNQSFFLNLWFDVPHAPYEPAPDIPLASYKNLAKGDDLLYRSMVTHLGHSVGRILTLLTDLGIEKNTMVIFSSDNGPVYQGSPGIFRGRKIDFHEGGIKVFD